MDKKDIKYIQKYLSLKGKYLKKLKKPLKKWSEKETKEPKRELDKLKKEFLYLRLRENNYKKRIIYLLELKGYIIKNKLIKKQKEDCLEFAKEEIESIKSNLFRDCISSLNLDFKKYAYILKGGKI